MFLFNVFDVTTFTPQIEKWLAEVARSKADYLWTVDKRFFWGLDFMGSNSPKGTPNPNKILITEFDFVQSAEIQSLNSTAPLLSVRIMPRDLSRW